MLARKCLRRGRTSRRAPMRRVRQRVQKQRPCTFRAQQQRNMATEQQLKARIKTVGNIQKITKAMKMVAASKLRQVEAKLQDARIFQQSISDSWPGLPEGEEAEGVEITPAKHKLLVAIASDRGLCGGVNSAVAKSIRLNVSQSLEAGQEVSIMTVGDKGKSALERRFKDRFTFALSEVGKQQPITFSEVSIVAEYMLASEFDEAEVVFNKYISAIAYDTVPVQFPSLERSLLNKKHWSDYNFEGEQREVLENLYEFRTAVKLYHFFIESATSEQSARMTAMDNSSKNAGEMLDQLTLQYNRRRQSKITTELTEIISGASSVEEAS